MKKLSKDTKFLLIDLLILICLYVSLLITNFLVHDAWAIWIVFSKILIVYGIYLLISLFYFFISGKNLPKVFFPRVLSASVLISSSLTILFSMYLAIFITICFIVSALKKGTNIYTKKDVLVFICTIILSIITAIVCIACFKFIFDYEFVLFIIGLFIIGLLHGIFSCAVLKKTRAWFYSFLIVSHMPIITIAGSLVGVLITRLIIYLKDRNKKQLNEAQSENDG